MLIVWLITEITMATVLNHKLIHIGEHGAFIRKYNCVVNYLKSLNWKKTF